jgi:hypothetical protein
MILDKLIFGFRKYGHWRKRCSWTKIQRWAQLFSQILSPNQKNIDFFILLFKFDLARTRLAILFLFESKNT